MINSDERARVVFDTGIVLQAALAYAGPSYQCLRLLEAERILVFLSPQVRAEYADVLTRPDIHRKNPQLTDERVHQILEEFDSKAQPVSVLRRRMEFPRDPNDEPILSLAIEAQADFLVARDKDLFALGNSPDFRLLFPTIHIVDPVTFLYRLLARHRESNKG